jgi:uncharacterized SAM-binding protein YcdF (DUF218 family)
MNLIRKIAKIILLAIIGAVVLGAALDAALVFGWPHIPQKIDRADAIIIMGAAINTPALYNRTMEGLKLYNEGKAPVMILSGGRISDADISEAQYMQKVIRQNSEKEPNMILEQSSHNTLENIRNSKAKLPKAKSVIIVSDEFHIARAVLTARSNGFDDVYWSYPEPSYYSRPELRKYYFREMAAMISYFPDFFSKR